MLKSVKHLRLPSRRRVPTLATVRDTLAIVALVLGGLWAATQFFFEKLIEPLLNPAMVKMEATLSKTHETECCIFLNLDISLKNESKREAHLESVFLAVGAKPFVLNKPDSQGLDNHTKHSKLDGFQSISNPRLATTISAIYGNFAPAEIDYKILLISNIVQPRTILGPNDTTHRRFAFATEKSDPLVSVRANAIVAHERIEDPRMLWHWRVKSRGMLIFPLPWSRDDSANLLAYEKCYRNSTRWSRGCALYIDQTAAENWKHLNTLDDKIFSLPFVMDSFVTIEKSTQ